MISQTAEYAFRAIVFLAERKGGRWPTKAIAETAKIPPGYLAKIMQSLAQGGVVTGRRGLNGGFSLSRAPEKITLLEVMQVVSPIRRIRECPLNLEEHSQQLCPLHSRLDAALAMIEETFRGSSVADLLVRPTFCHKMKDPGEQI